MVFWFHRKVCKESILRSKRETWSSPTPGTKCLTHQSKMRAGKIEVSSLLWSPERILKPNTECRGCSLALICMRVGERIVCSRVSGWTLGRTRSMTKMKSTLCKKWRKNYLELNRRTRLTFILRTDVSSRLKQGLPATKYWNMDPNTYLMQTILNLFISTKSTFWKTVWIENLKDLPQASTLWRE